MTQYLYQEANWQSQLSDLITDPQELLQILQLSPDQLLSGALLASQAFKLRVPRAFVSRMQPGNPFRSTFITSVTASSGTGRPSGICHRSPR